MDKISIKNLELFAKHGVFPEERVLGQKFVVSAALYLDLRVAGKSDKLEESINYAAVCGDIKEFVEGNTFNLIETVAEGLAEMLLLRYPSLKKVWLEVKKPWARLGVQIETVSVEIERAWHRAYIALGSNMGDRESYLNTAVRGLGQSQGCRVVRVSEYINTKPYGNTNQDDFLNACLELETLLTPHELLALLQKLENYAGRIRTEHWGPRTLDLDIIFYDDVIISENDLRIPHPEMHKREFVLRPLNEIAPNKLHPTQKKTVAELLETLT